ncbi:MAG: hypothetical protein B6245_07690 [Desulfobacteraceae bacterium 4572_88]|nr:MAG: hypothetical protein B6245_07690 [Desulfobacteraceae bacterium 4572_88]
MDEKRRLYIRQELEKATFKITAIHSGEIGTGFFISSDGYFLTAYHCVENKLKPDETCFHLKLEFSDGEARTDDFMLLKGSNKAADLAVFKSTYPHPGFVPLGLITAEHFTHRITAPGFPAVHKEQGKSLGFYEGTISRFNEANKEQFETDAIQGTGHSGGPVYDYDLDRVVGLVQDEMSSEEMKKAGFALRFDALFEKWPELKSDSEQVGARWDRRIRDDSESEKDKDKDEAKTGCGRRGFGFVNPNRAMGNRAGY